MGDNKQKYSALALSDTPHSEQLAMLATCLQPAQKCTLLCEVLFSLHLIFPHYIFPEIPIFPTHKMLAYTFSFLSILENLG